MSLRSLFLAALLFAVFAAAQYDVFMSVRLNMTPVMQCVADAPNRCFYVPRIDLNIDPTKTLAIVTFRDGTYVRAVTNPIGDYLLLRYIMSNTWYSWYIVSIPRPGLLYSPNPFKIGPAGSKSQTPASSYTACGKTYANAYHIAAPGAYNITPLQPPFYVLDLDKCVEYRIVEHQSAVDNITAGWYSLYLAELNPPARAIYYGGYSGSASYAYVLNGTFHAYLTYFHGALQPLGEGFYILQSRTAAHVASTLVMPAYSYGIFYSQRGPVAYDTWPDFRTYVGALGAVYVAYNIGLPPGDAYHMALLQGANPPPAPAELVYVADSGDGSGGASGYFLVKEQRPGAGASYITYHRRYAVVHVSFSDGVYAYDTRGLACPMTSVYGTGWTLNRLERSYEIEICNNNTNTVYVALYSGILYGTNVYMYGDRVQPRNCTRLRWDAAIDTKPYLRVYTTPQGLCAAANNYTLSTTNYSPGWRYNLIGSSLVPVRPISPDYDYVSQLLELLKWLSQLYRNLQGNFSRYVNKTRSANATAFNLTSIYASMPQFIGTIKMESATSTWLRTTLNELQRWRVVGPAVGGAVSVSLQAPSALAASAAATAVATAWAASRRSLATAAFLAGFAILASSLFVYYLYGATVTVGLILAAVALMSIGAAAAWFRRAED